MSESSSPHRLRILILLVLLLAVSLGCSCGQILQEWLTQFLQDLTRAIELWIRQVIAQFIADLQRQIVDWWNGLLRDIQRGLEDTWREIRQGVADFWSSIFPPAPVITEPADGLTVAGANLKVRGTARQDATVTLFRNGAAHRTAKADAAGRWTVDDALLNKGENVLTAQVKVALFPSPPSAPVRVNWAGAELGAVPAMTPAIDAGLDPSAWMLELAMERVKAGGESLYESQRAAYTDALRKGLQASAGDDISHHFINPDRPLTFGKFALVLLAPKEMPTAEILETLGETLEAVVLDEAVRTEVMRQISGSMERLDVFWTVTERSATFEWQYVRIDFDAAYLEQNFDPSALARLKTALFSGFLKNLGAEVSGVLAERIVKLAFAVWGQADADSQAQHYFDLAVRAWNHRGPDGQPLPWDDAAANGFDGDIGYSFASNEEWAMFYLGRAAFYAQSVADPYYTIPFYTPASELWAGYAHRVVSEVAKARLAKVAAARYGAVVGGGGPITAIFTAVTIFEWMKPYWRYLDAREIRDAHRPNFAGFVAGSDFESPMPDDLKELGARTDRVGYPYRGPADLLLHGYLGAAGTSVEQRTITPTVRFDSETILRPAAALVSLRAVGDPASLVRRVAQHSVGYVHSGNFMQSDRRVPEGDMIYPNAYFIREVYACRRMDGSSGPWWEAAAGARLRLTLLDGSVLDGRVEYQPGQPLQQRYVDGQHYVAYAPIRVVGLSEVNYLSGSMASFPFTTVTLMTVVGDEQHLYAVFDPARAAPFEASSADVPTMTTVAIGIAGNRAGAKLFERDGVAQIAVNRLAVGTLATERLLQQFAAAAPAYRPPDPIVCPADAVCAALHSPATLHLRDRRGRHVGPNAAGGVDLQISGSRYFTNTQTGQQFIVVPKANLGEGYTVRVEGAGSGTFDLDLFYGDRPRDRAYRLAYDDVPVAAGAVAEVAVQATDRLSLRVDEDGNGVFDRELTPTRAIAVAVYEPARRQDTWILLLAGGALIVLGLVLIVVIVRHFRRRRSPPPPPPSAGPSALSCPRCGTVARPGARFCLNCGAALAPAIASPPAMSVCPACGAVATRPGARFCQRCGGPL
jgi:hypothetical protein